MVDILGGIVEVGNSYCIIVSWDPVPLCGQISLEALLLKIGCCLIVDTDYSNSDGDRWCHTASQGHLASGL